MKSLLLRPTGYLIVLAFFAFLVIGFINLFARPTFSQVPPSDPTTHNVFGYIWSSNIGWISLSCDNDSSCGSVDYGVDILSDGSFDGYAWSPNIGWIDFSPEPTSGSDPANSYFTSWPSGANTGVAVDIITREVTGWARVVNAGLEDSYGWILFGPNGDSLVTVDPTTGQFSGWAFGGPANSDTAVVGWVTLNTTNCPGACGAGPEHFMATNFPFSSIVIDSVATSIPDWCEAATDGDGNPKGGLGAADVIFGIDFTDTNDTFKDIHIQITEESRDFDNWIVDFQRGSANTTEGTEIVSGIRIYPTDSPNAGQVGSNKLTYDTTYKWRVELIDQVTGETSGWTDGDITFTTPEHEYPFVDFTWNPTQLRIDAESEFASLEFDRLSHSNHPTDLSMTFRWDFDYHVNPGWDPALNPWEDPLGCHLDPLVPCNVDRVFNDQNPIWVYTEAGEKTVRLEGTDASGPPYVCTAEHVIGIQPSSPVYCEVNPSGIGCDLSE